MIMKMNRLVFKQKNFLGTSEINQRHLVQRNPPAFIDECNILIIHDEILYVTI